MGSKMRLLILFGGLLVLIPGRQGGFLTGRVPPLPPPADGQGPLPAGPAGQGGFLTGPMNPSNDYGMGSAAQANPCTSRCTMFGFQADLEYLYTHGMIGIEHRYLVILKFSSKFELRTKLIKPISKVMAFILFLNLKNKDRWATNKNIVSKKLWG